MILCLDESRSAFDLIMPRASLFTSQGLGRVAMLACILGLMLGVHLILAIFICLYYYGLVEQTLVGVNRMQLLLQWCLYAMTLCTFHLLEFLVTAIYNPQVTSSDSFLINHSIAYTAAALVCAVCDCYHDTTQSPCMRWLPRAILSRRRLTHTVVCPFIDVVDGILDSLLVLSSI